MPARRSGPKRSPKASDADSAPTNGTSSANGATVAAGYRRSSAPHSA